MKSTIARRLVPLALLGLGAGSAALAINATTSPSSDAVLATLKERLPKTKVSGVNCEKMTGLCEVVAGDNLFYVDRSARYLVIGRVYDMQTRQDITAARLLEMNPDMLVGGAAKANAEADAPAAPTPAAGQPAAPVVSRRVDLSSLSKSGAITWGKGGPMVTVFSDVHCGYCRALAQALGSMNVTVIERPISVLGSRDVANQVICSKNKTAALHAAYAREPIAGSGACDTRGLDENESFARRHGFSGTPVIVRADGVVIEGYRPKEQLTAWIKGAKS